MALDRELRTYQRNRPALLEHVGQWVLIHGDTVAGLYSTREDAADYAYEHIYPAPFLIMQVGVYELVAFPTPDMRPFPAIQ